MGWSPVKSAFNFVGSGLKKISGPLSLINSGLGITAGLTGSILDTSDPATDAQLSINDKNLALQREMNQQNLANWQTEFEYNKSINQRNFDYTVAQNALTRQREDNAIQRQVADAESAGLSPLAVVGSGGANSSVVSAPSALSAPSAPEMRTPVLSAPDFQNDLRTQLALLDFASQAFLQDKKLSSDEKINKVQTSTQKFIAISQLENAKKIADSANDTQLTITTNQLLELNRSNTAKEYQAKLDYFQKTVSQITDGHGRFIYGKYDEDTCRRHNEEISTRWAEFIKSLPADSLSKSKSDTTSVNGGLGVNKSGSSGSGSGSGNRGKWQTVTDHLMKGFGVDANLGVTKGQSDADSVGQSSSVQALIKSFWLRNENVLWIPKGGNF